MSNSSLTICILTHNRYEHLKRLLRYYQDSEYSFDLIILDSSPVKSVDKELSFLLDKTGASLKYFPEDTFFAEKLSQGLSYVDTEYAVLCADDDFLIPQGLNKAVKFLKNHKDFSSAHGIYCSHSSEISNGVEWGINYPFSRSNKNPDALKRFKKFFPGNYSSYPFYAVHQTKTLKAIWKKTNEHVSDWGWVEIFPSSMSIILGKSKKLLVLYSSREINAHNAFDKKRMDTMFEDSKNDIAILGLTDLFKEMGFEKHVAKKLISNQLNIYKDLTSKKDVFQSSVILYIRFPKLFFSRLVSEFLKFYVYIMERKKISKIHNLLLSYKISTEQIIESRKSY